MPPVPLPDVIAALESGVPLLTATQRLAREWRRRYDDAQRGQGRAVWPSADVLPWSAWVRRAFEEGLDCGALGLTAAPNAAPDAAGTTPGTRGGSETGSSSGAISLAVVLSEGQAHAVWEGIVAAAPHGLPRTRAASLVPRAREAWRRLAEWRLALPQPERDAPLEQRAFAAWAQAYLARCRDEGWQDPAQVPERLIAALDAGQVVPPGRLLLAGFDELPPLTEALLDALRRTGTTVEPVPLPRLGRAAVRTVPADAEDEAWAAAHWVRHWLAAAPDARIGIVVPELSERRAQLVRVLEDVLAPGIALPAGDPGARPFEVSIGLALTEYPLAATALALLGLHRGEQPLETWSLLLRSPFLAGAEQERDARARLDVRLRRWGDPGLSAQRVQAAAEQHTAGLPAAGQSAAGQPAAPALAAALGRWRVLWDALPARQAPPAWAQSFDALLRALGWPGERPLDSAEHQTLEKWHGVLEELARLGLVTPQQSWAEALAALRRLAAEAEFQPQGADAPLHVLGSLEAAGLEFDHLWLLGMHEDVWPPPPRPNPFLPGALQRRHGMPRASVERELALAQRATERLLHAAPDVVASHPARDGERPLRLSALLRHLPQAPAHQPALAAPGARYPLREAVGAAARLETLSDDVAPPVATGTAVPGGTRLFQEQAACPFRAFAHHRLHARAPEVPQPGLDALTRGSLVHAALERAWRRIRDHAALRALAPEAEASLLGEVVQEALDAWQEQQRRTLPPRLAALERRRLQGLLRDWLALERERTPFSVELIEAPQSLEIGGISVSGRVDRIDRMPDGTRLLIDYKTGQTRLAAWWGERPDEPQLPLYAASGGEPLAGVAFAQVRRQELAFRGVADDPARFPSAQRFDKIKAPGAPFGSMAQVVEEWRAALEALGGRFRAGDARVDPKEPRTCTYCDLAGLCRIAELRPAAQDEEGSDGSDGDDGGAVDRTGGGVGAEGTHGER